MKLLYALKRIHDVTSPNTFVLNLSLLHTGYGEAIRCNVLRIEFYSEEGAIRFLRNFAPIYEVTRYYVSECRNLHVNHHIDWKYYNFIYNVFTNTEWAKKKYHISNVYSTRTVKDTTNFVVTQERIYKIVFVFLFLKWYLQGGGHH